MCAQLIETTVERANGDEEVLIGITDPAKIARGPERVARESLVRWCIQHRLPVPPEREARCR